jgi:hypothetical protein
MSETWFGRGRGAPTQAQLFCSHERLRVTHLFLLTMDSFDNFQYDSASSYGGMGVVDDTSSIYTSNTQGHVPVDIDRLSILDDPLAPSSSIENDLELQSTNGSITDDFDAVLDDLKEESQVDLPPHACWFVFIMFHLLRTLSDLADRW